MNIMKNLDLAGTDYYEKVFQNSIMESCDFSKSCFIDAVFSDCSIKNCDFSGSYGWYAIFNRVLFEGVCFSRASYCHAQFINCVFAGCQFDLVDLSCSRFQRNTFKKAVNLRELIDPFYRQKLQGENEEDGMVRFFGANFHRASFLNNKFEIL